jgi:hypothetical protein
LGYEKEENLYSVKNVNIFEKILEIIEMYGHAMYIEKNRLINKNSGGVL